MGAGIEVEEIHDTGGDYPRLGWYARGHHAEADFMVALAEQYPEEDRGTMDADASRCVFRHVWWRKIPIPGGWQFREAGAHARGAFKATAFSVPEFAP